MVSSLRIGFSFSLVIVLYCRLIKAFLIPLIICFINVISFFWMPPPHSPTTVEPLNHWGYSLSFSYPILISYVTYFLIWKYIISCIWISGLKKKKIVFSIIFGLVPHCQCLSHTGSPWGNSQTILLAYCSLSFLPCSFSPSFL